MNSLEYWRNREDEQTSIYQKDEKQVEKEIAEIYQNTLDNVEKEINAFYAKYATKEGITIQEAKRRVTKADIEEYEKKAEKYVKLASQDRANGTDANAHIYFSNKANEEMALYNLTMKVNRLEMLKSKIGLELVKGNAEAEAKMQKQLEKRSLEEMKRQAGILGESINNQLKKANSIVTGSFHNATFSDRIWANMDMLKAKIDTLLQQGMIQGKGARQLASNIRKEFNVTTFQAERLMRTELARIQIETQKESYMRNGFEEYEFIANSGCCDTCQALNGKIFKVKKMMPGENAAPIHPNCRCSTAPYEDSEEYEAWLDYLSKGGTTEQYNQFKLTNNSKSNKINTGARILDPYDEDGEKFAKMYYKEIQSFTTDVAKIAKNTEKKEEDIQNIKDYLFFNKSFSPDCSIAQSWQRLMLGKDIKKHDITLIEHELYEMKLKEDNPNISHDEAHIIATHKHNYQKEADEYYGNLNKRNKKR